MKAFDLDNPLPVDDCEICRAAHWSRCSCDSASVDVDAMFALKPAEGDDPS